ncbi:MAG: YHYH protein [Chloroflexi bacterium]|nr:YHYH protein [Chloroflexota bacterium]
MGHPTGTYPLASSDPAYQIDPFPFEISEQMLELSLPLNPTLAATPACLNSGTIGVALTGAQVFNALDGLGRDAAAYEVLDLCGGHPEERGKYHYHTAGDCRKEPHTLGHTLTAYALDGFGLFGLYDSQGQELTNDDLDECHGHTHDIDWDGAEISSYHYHLTNAYPYTLGCYRGSEVVQQMSGGMMGEGGGMMGPGGQMPPPPPPY